MHPIETTNPTVLLVDDCPFTRRALTTAIESSMPECKVICVPTIEEAQVAGAELNVDLFIVDSRLPDGSGIDFLADMIMVHGSAGFIFMADGPLPAHIDKYHWMDEVHILRKAINRAQLLRMMREILGHRAENSSTRNNPLKNVWSARLEEISAEEIVYQKIDSLASTILEFVSRGETGKVYLLNGKVTHAETGDLEDNEALSKILSWRRGFAFEIPCRPATPKVNEDSSNKDDSGSDKQDRDDRHAEPKYAEVAETAVSETRSAFSGVLSWLNKAVNSTNLLPSGLLLAKRMF